MRLLFCAIADLVVSWWRTDRIRVSPCEGRLLRLTPGSIVFVAGEALAGIWCPLTVWEAALRGSRADRSFVAQWIHRILFYDFPEWVFTVAHVLFTLVVAASWFCIRPTKK